MCEHTNLIWSLAFNNADSLHGKNLICLQPEPSQWICWTNSKKFSKLIHKQIWFQEVKWDWRQRISLNFSLFLSQMYIVWLQKTWNIVHESLLWWWFNILFDAWQLQSSSVVIAWGKLPVYSSKFSVPQKKVINLNVNNYVNKFQCKFYRNMIKTSFFWSAFSVNLNLFHCL